MNDVLQIIMAEIFEGLTSISLVLDSKAKNAKLNRHAKHIQELIEKIEPEDGGNVFVYENIND
jgi:hypothetical protein